MIGERQLLANRRNAGHSTGPRSAEGKEASRGNALKHGLAARKLLPSQDREAVAERAAQWNSSLRPGNPWEVWLVDQIATESLRAERCAREEGALRDRLAQRAELCWDDDRRGEAEALARGLAADPASVRSGLEATRHGCEWLIARWDELLAVLDAGAAWDEGQASRARDLLGSAAEPGAARAEMDRLKLRLDEVLLPLDETDRALAESGMGGDPGGEIRRVRRYETSCLRRLEWAWSQLKKGRRDAPGPSTKPPARPAEISMNEPDEFEDLALERAPTQAEWDSLAERLSGFAALEVLAPSGTTRGPVGLAEAVRDRGREERPAGNRRARRAARKGR